MARKTVVAGEFYEGNFETLNKQIEECFYSKKGPGDLPAKRTDKKIKAIIAPHAGYFFSGACAAWSYMEIAESKFPDAFLILGPNHYGIGSGVSIEDWETPLGIVRTHKELIKGIVQNTDLKIKEENHVSEHSIEVQLPLLQFANKDRMQDIRIIPVAIGQDLEFEKIGKQLYDFFKKTNKEIVIIISSDFTHYGRNYHYVPFSTDIPERITALDKGAIDLLMNLDTKGFRDYINNTGITICGYMPILVFLAMMDNSEIKPRANLLMHYTSGDLLGDYKNSVSYVSMSFR
jgi:MEMO1 family protein